jgi:hypothetical protein
LSPFSFWSRCILEAATSNAPQSDNEDALCQPIAPNVLFTQLAIYLLHSSENTIKGVARFHGVLII